MQLVRRSGRWPAVAVTIVVSVVLHGTVAAAAPALVPDPTWMTNGKVFATALSADGSTLYIGGKFTKLLPPSGGSGTAIARSNLAAIDVATGEPVPGWNVPVTGDKSFVRALAVQAGVLYVGGRFTAVNGMARTNLAALVASSGELTAFAPGVGEKPGNAVYAVLASADRLYVGGAFGKVDGLTRGKFAAFDLPAGTLSKAWKPIAKKGAVRALVFDTAGETVFAAGAFNAVAYKGTTYRRESLVRLVAETGAVHPWAVAIGVIGDPQTGWDLVATPTRLYGGFGRGPNFAAAFTLDEGDTGRALWKRGFVGNVQTVRLSSDGQRLYTGGHFGLGRLQQQVCGGTYLRGLVSLAPSNGGFFCDWIPQLAPYGNNYQGPWTMLETGGKLWVGGGWTTVGDLKQRNLARFGL